MGNNDETPEICQAPQHVTTLYVTFKKMICILFLITKLDNKVIFYIISDIYE